MKWLILGFVVLIAALKIAFSEAQPAPTGPVINLDANAHQIVVIPHDGSGGNCTWASTMDVYVDGQFYQTFTNRPPALKGFNFAGR